MNSKYAIMVQYVDQAFFRGIYLASVLYKEEKVLCTVDDNLPVILVDENTPSSLTSEINWMMKVSCAWEDSKWLQYDTNDACQSSPNVQFRQKLLDAACQMQAALGVQDLGRLHSRPLIDSQGSVILVTVQYVSDVKTVQVSSRTASNIPSPKYV